MKIIATGLAIALVACGGAPVIDNAAESAAQRSRQSQRALPPPDRFDRGGMAGCFDPNLSGYERAAAERIGGVPCEAPRRTTPNAAPARGSNWLVGAWVQRGWRCGGEGWRFEASGDYFSPEGSGRWSLAGSTLSTTLTSRASADGRLGEEAPVRNPRPAVSEVVARTAREFTLRHANGSVSQWTRCG